MTWGQYQFPFTPLVDKYKWLEPRHMVNISDRWKRDKTDDLQFAFFNGVGWESWENIWGIWNGITPRDAEATRRVATIERAIAPFLVSKDWEPMTPDASLRRLCQPLAAGQQAVWTIVNRNEYDVEGDQIEIRSHDWHPLLRSISRSGTEASKPGRAEELCLPSPSKPRDTAQCWPPTPRPIRSIETLMSKMKELTATPLPTYSHEWKVLPQQIVPIQATKAAGTTPAGMVKIPEADLLFKRFWNRDRRVQRHRCRRSVSLGGFSPALPRTPDPRECLFTSTSTRSRMPNSRSSSTPLTIIRKMI